jgi:hypothetical protein
MVAPDAVAATAVAFFVLSIRLARSTLASSGRQRPRRWRPRVIIVLVFSDAGPLHDVGRLVQRLTLLAVSSLAGLLSARLLRIAGQ